MGPWVNMRLPEGGEVLLRPGDLIGRHWRCALELADVQFKGRPAANGIFVITRFEWALLAGELDTARALLARWDTLRGDPGPIDPFGRLQRARLALVTARVLGTEDVEEREAELRGALEDLTTNYGAFPTLVRRVERQLSDGPASGAR